MELTDYINYAMKSLLKNSILIHTLNVVPCSNTFVIFLFIIFKIEYLTLQREEKHTQN